MSLRLLLVVVFINIVVNIVIVVAISRRLPRQCCHLPLIFFFDYHSTNAAGLATRITAHFDVVLRDSISIQSGPNGDGRARQMIFGMRTGHLLPRTGRTLLTCLIGRQGEHRGIGIRALNKSNARFGRTAAGFMDDVFLLDRQ